MVYVKQSWINSPSTASPLSGARLNHLETQFDEAKTYADTQLATKASIDYVNAAVSGASIPFSRVGASIKHVEQSQYSYEVIRVSGGFGAIQKIQPAAVTSTGTIPEAGLLTPRQMSAQSGFQALVNCDAYGGTTTKRIVGLHIIDGVAVQNFGVQTDTGTGSNLEALVLMRDGSLRAARASDNKSADDYVNEGAYASFGYGPILIENGVIPTWWTDPRFSFFSGTISARTILGQAANGDYIIITVDGATGSSGILGQTLSTIAQAEGCVIAVNLDGGGTTQTMWRGEIIHPSSDSSGSRSSMSYLAIAVPTNNEYDSGIIPIPTTSTFTAGTGAPAALSVRQRGSMVSLRFSLAGAIPADSWVTVTANPIPPRYVAEAEDFNRGVIYGTTGAPVGVSIGSLAVPTVSIRSRVYATALNSAGGTLTYRARFS